jgi:hypothetical protein
MKEANHIRRSGEEEEKEVDEDEEGGEMGEVVQDVGPGLGPDEVNNDEEDDDMDEDGAGEMDGIVDEVDTAVPPAADGTKLDEEDIVDTGHVEAFFRSAADEVAFDGPKKLLSIWKL